MGIQTNLTDNANWRFIAAFLLVRAFALVGCGIIALLHRGSVGTVMTYWMCATWISTVILGVPILSAMLGTAYANLGVLAGVSSFIFQLPVMLVGFEVDWSRRRGQQRSGQHGQLGDSKALGAMLGQQQKRHCVWSLTKQHGGGNHLVTDAYTPDAYTSGHQHGDTYDSSTNHDTHDIIQQHSVDRVPRQPSNARDEDDEDVERALHPPPPQPPPPPPRIRWRLLSTRLLNNHVLWAIVIGLILSLSTVGWKYLDPTSKQYVQETGFITAWLELLGRTAEPLALFATGMFFATRLMYWWGQAHGGGGVDRVHSDAACVVSTTGVHSAPTKQILPPPPTPTPTRWQLLTTTTCITIARLVLYMTAKLILVPLVAVGCACLLDLQGPYGRALVLLAVLPVSPAAFALASEYDIRCGEVGWNVAGGTLLMLPATIAWQAVLDALGVFVV